MAEPGATGAPRPLVELTHKHTFAVKNHMLSGITLPAWLCLLWRHGREIDWWPYLPRVLFLTLLAGFNSLLALPDQLLWRRAVRNTTLHPEPVFILGHPRTGTTHLHNLLSLDSAFAWADTLAAGFPSSFLSLGPGLAAAAAPLLDATRPMDSMALSFGTPAEDEIAVCAATGGVSPYMPLVFMRDQRRFWDYFTLERCSDADRATWLNAFTWFLKKVTLRAGAPKPKPLLIKSPVHTARIPLLLKLFPRARFLYIHRHPYDVFRSAAHMADSYYVYTALQRMTAGDVTDFVLDQFELLHDTYQEGKRLIPIGNLMELSFQELDGDPVGTLRRIYGQFGWSERFGALEPGVRAYCGSLADFKKNSFSSLAPEMKRIVAERWHGYFEAFGYEA